MLAPLSEDLQARLKALRESCNPAQRLKRFEQACADYQQRGEWKADDPQRWAALDSHLGQETLDQIDRDILKQLAESARATRTAAATAALPQAQVPGRTQSTTTPDVVFRIRSLARCDWRVRPHQILRDLSADAFRCPRPILKIATEVLGPDGRCAVSWLDAVLAIKAMARLRKEHPRKGLSKSKEVQKIDVEKAEQSLRERWPAKPDVQDGRPIDEQQGVKDATVADEQQGEEDAMIVDQQRNATDSQDGDEQQSMQQGGNHQTVEDGTDVGEQQSPRQDGSHQTLEDSGTIDEHQSTKNGQNLDEQQSVQQDRPADEQQSVQHTRATDKQQSVQDGGVLQQSRVHGKQAGCEMLPTLEELPEPVTPIRTAMQAKGFDGTEGHNMPDSSSHSVHQTASESGSTAMDLASLPCRAGTKRFASQQHTQSPCKKARSSSSPRFLYHRVARMPKPPAPNERSVSPVANGSQTPEIELGRGVPVSSPSPTLSSSPGPVGAHLSLSLDDNEADFVEPTLLAEQPVPTTPHHTVTAQHVSSAATDQRSPSPLPTIERLDDGGSLPNRNIQQQLLSAKSLKPSAPTSVSLSGKSYLGAASNMASLRTAGTTATHAPCTTTTGTSERPAIAIAATKAGSSAPALSRQDIACHASSNSIATPVVQKITRLDLSTLLKSKTSCNQPIPPTTRDGVLQTLQPGKWLSVSAVTEGLSAFNPLPSQGRVYEGGFLNLHDNAAVVQAGRNIRAKGLGDSRHYLPIADRNHFTVTIVDPAAATYEVYDPLGEHPNRLISDAANLFAGAVLADARAITIRPPPHLQQHNSYDCGIYVIARTVLDMHNRPCPTAIIPEVWRRAVAAFVSQPDPKSDIPFSPLRMVEKLATAWRLVCSYTTEELFSQGVFTLNADSTADILTTVTHVDHIRQSLNLLLAETILVLDLLQSSYHPRIAQQKIDWLHQEKDRVPDCLPEVHRRDLQAPLERKIAEERKLLARSKPQCFWDAAVHTLTEDVARYKLFSERAAAIADRLQEDYDQKLKQRLSRLREALAASEELRQARMN